MLGIENKEIERDIERINDLISKESKDNQLKLYLLLNLMANSTNYVKIRSQISQNVDNQPQQEKEDNSISTEFELVKALLDNYLNPKLYSSSMLDDLNMILNL